MPFIRKGNMMIIIHYNCSYFSQHKSALSEYRLGLTYLTDNIKDDDDEKELMVTLYNNISAVYCKLSEYPQALKAANDVIIGINNKSLSTR